MLRVLILVISLLHSFLAYAKPGYQIDLILFASKKLAIPEEQLNLTSTFLPLNSNSISLKSNSGKIPKLYYLLPNSYSALRDQYYQLSHRSPYLVLGHYSWRQPANSYQTVALPLMRHQGWEMQGTIRVQANNYYTFDADLKISPTNTPISSFTVIQKQRLKENVLYYLDHEQIGMVIKIHKFV